MECKRQIGSWRQARPHCAPPRTESTSRELRGWFPATRFFDQLSYVGDARYGCFVLETEEGLVQFDCLNPDQYSIDVLEEGYRELGLDPHDLKAILVTHGHGDHWGCSKYMREQYGCKIYMSQADFAYARDLQVLGLDGMPARRHMNFDVDGYLEGGDVFRLGNTEIQVYATPGHSPGGLSFIFPVTDEGRPHMAAIWGGTGAPRGSKACRIYLESLDYFTWACVEQGVDVELSAHPFVDNAVEKLALCRNIFDGVANPFVMDTGAVCRFMLMLRERLLDRLAQEEKKEQAEG